MRGLKDIFIGACKIPIGIMIAPAHHAKWDMPHTQRQWHEEGSDSLIRGGFKQIANGIKLLFSKEGWVIDTESIKPSSNGKFLDL
jgi:hypothetical protein